MVDDSQSTYQLTHLLSNRQNDFEQRDVPTNADVHEEKKDVTSHMASRRSVGLEKKKLSMWGSNPRPQD